MDYGLNKFGEGTGVYAKQADAPSAPSETQIVNAIIKAVRKAYPDSIVVKIHGGGFQKAGIPDLYIATGGINLWVEVKRPGGDTTALQKRFLESLRLNGIPCGTAESPERVLEMIEQTLHLYDDHY